MIPGPDGDEPLLPPLTPGFGLLLATSVGMLQVALIVVLAGSGFRGIGVYGMAAIPAYAAAFAVCMARLDAPPSERLALLRPRPLIWWSIFFLAWSLLLSSELDNLTQAFFPIPEPLTEAAEPPSLPFAPLLLVFCVVGPLTQELLFRGAIQPVMIEQLGVGRGIAFTSLQNGVAVALGTLNPWALVPSTVNAAVLGILRHSSGSLYPSLALHAVSGLATLLASYGAFGIGGFDDTSEARTSLAWLLPAAVFTGIGLRLCKAVAAAPPPSQETDPV